MHALTDEYDVKNDRMLEDLHILTVKSNLEVLKEEEIS